MITIKIIRQTIIIRWPLLCGNHIKWIYKLNVDQMLTVEIQSSLRKLISKSKNITFLEKSRKSSV